MSDSKQHSGFSFHISETPPPVGARAGTTLADLELDLGEFGAPAEEISPPVQSNAVPSPKPQKSAWLDSPKAPEIQLDPVPASVQTPAIKKIRFPKSGVPSKPPASLRSAEKTPSPTRFSDSIRASKVRVHLDSEPDMAEPEDLPGVDADGGGQTESGPGWSTDTPHAREIWRKARSTWKSASKKAASLSEHGVRASKALAESMGEKVRDKMRESSEEKQRRTEERSRASESAAPEGAVAAERNPGPSVASRVILGLARGAAKKSAAPLSALVAASVVYLAGSYLLGPSDTVALSKVTKGPDIPDLGTLGTQEDKSASVEAIDKSAQGAKGTEKPASQGPPPMEIEMTNMPEGMSWPGKGLIEVVTSAEELVYVDGVFTGRGPLRRIPVSPGPHEISIRADGKERTGKAQVEAGRATRAVFKAE